MFRLAAAFLLVFIGVVIGYVIGVVFCVNRYTYDYVDIERAYEEGFNAGLKAGGWTEDGEEG